MPSNLFRPLGRPFSLRNVLGGDNTVRQVFFFFFNFHCVRLGEMRGDQRRARCSKRDNREIFTPFPDSWLILFHFSVQKGPVSCCTPYCIKEQSAFPGKFRRRSPTPPGQLRSDSEGRVLWSCRCCIFPLDLEFYFFIF